MLSKTKTGGAKIRKGGILQKTTKAITLKCVTCGRITCTGCCTELDKRWAGDQ